MASSERTKKLRNLKNGFLIVDTLSWLGMAVFTVISALCLFESKDSSGMPIFSDEFKTLLASLSITVVVGVIGAIIIKDKIRTTIFMLCLMLNTIMFKEPGMYITLAIWFLDEYIFHGLYVSFKSKLLINKEIDLRG